MSRLNGRRTLPPGPVILTLLIVSVVLIGLVVRQVRQKAARGNQAGQPTLAPLTHAVLPTATSATLLLGKVPDAANFRTGPSIQASVIKLLPSGTEVRLIARQQTTNGGWYLVQVAGQEGWLSDQVLTIDPAAAAFVPMRTAMVPDAGPSSVNISTAKPVAP